MDSPSVVLSCLIASTPGLGSEEVCYALAASGVVGNPSDYFDPLKAPSRSREWRILGSEREFPVRYIESVQESGTGHNGVCSMEVTWPHLRWMLHICRAALGASDDRAIRTDAEVVEACFPKLRYFHLRSRDTGLQAVRWYEALYPVIEDPGDRLGSSGRRPPKSEAVRSLESLLQRYERSWNSFLEIHGIVAKAVYLDFSPDSVATCANEIIESL